MGALQRDDHLVAANGEQSWRVEQLIGCGAQGCVYEAIGDAGPVAVKWFVDDWASVDHLQTIDRLVATEAPLPDLVWPQAIVTCPQRDGFGYVMRLVERPPHVELAEVMSRRVQPTHTALVNSGLTVARAIARLHERQLCYRDLSHANIMLDPVLGQTAVFDVDNVAPVDAPAATGIAGTPGYLAPETITAGAPVGLAADLHALAVLIFLLLVNHHPLKGRQEFAYPVFDTAAQNELYGAKARFIFDRARDDNRPDPQEHPNAQVYWSILPLHVRNRFHQAFEVGLGQPSRRVTAAEWVGTLQRLADGIYLCPDCGAEIYDNPALADAAPCWGCITQRTERLVLVTGATRVALHPGRTHPGPELPGAVITERHLLGQGGDERRVIGRIVPPTTSRGWIMLDNVSGRPWTVGVLHGVQTATVPAGHRISLRPDFWFDFGKGERATIRSGPETSATTHTGGRQEGAS